MQKQKEEKSTSTDMESGNTQVGKYAQGSPSERESEARHDGRKQGNNMHYGCQAVKERKIQHEMRMTKKRRKRALAEERVHHT